MKRWYPWIGLGVVILIVCLIAAQWVTAASMRNTRNPVIQAAVIAATATPVSASSLESMQRQLFDPKLDVASRESLMEKIDLQKKADADREAGISNPAPKDATGALPQANSAMAQAENSSGIYEGSDAIVKPDEAQVNNYWQGKLGDLDTVVLAGSVPNDPTQGLILLISSGSGAQTGSYERFLTPEKNGSLRIVSVHDTRIVLQTANGGQIQFDLTQKGFVN
jgi:hypothetical protein